MNNVIYISPFLGKPLTESKRREIKDFFNHTFQLYENLYECLNSNEAFYQRPETLRHPLIFYFGHTATFFVNKLILAKIIDQRVNESFESLFAVGVDEMSWDDLNYDNITWPRVEEVRQYRNTVQKIVNQAIDDLPLGEGIDWNHPAWIILMGVEHELIHLETSSVLIRQIDISYIDQQVEGWATCKEYGEKTLKNSFIKIKGEKIQLGISSPSDYYGWDNEYGEDIQEVKDFLVSQYLVSNADYLEFVQDRGYRNSKWWTEEGLSWLEFKKPSHPVFWVKDDAQPWGYRLRNMIEEIMLPLNWPVEVNFFEAKAYCNWYSESKGMSVRLPSEHEWHSMYHQNYIGNDREEHGNTNFHLAHFASSCPVDKFKHGELYDVCGNVWQWTESPIRPFQGFKPHPYYDDFSIPTFDDKHNIIKGGSWISGGNCARKESRYAFRKHFFQHAGFRMVHTEHKINRNVNSYETDEACSIYLDAHYGSKSYLGREPFAVAIINYASKFWNGSQKRKALDVGCSVGRSSFELGRYFDEVTGIDFSTHFIRYAHQLKELQTVKYQTLVEGSIYERKSIHVDDLQLNGREKNVQFYQGDACNMSSKLKELDFVLAANLMDRLYNPRLFLSELNMRMNEGGLLLITSPFTWKEEFTEKEKWLGGNMEGDKPVYSSRVIRETLADNFELLDETQDIPFILKETNRKYQYILPYVGVWKKKELTK